ncbi:MAG: M4 family metallopeptidase [Taibaiella sp.]|nr:M4 family metallopeptidase [Taibaiella sp.]
MLTKAPVRYRYACLAACAFLLSAFSSKAGEHSPEVLSVNHNTRNNTPSSIVFSPSANYHAADAQRIFAKYLNLEGTGSEMRLLNVTTTKKDITTYKYEQWFKGINIKCGTYTMVVKNNNVTLITGNFYNTDAEESVTATLTEAQAFSKALDFVGAEKYMWQDAAEEQFIKTSYGKPDTSYLPHGKITWIEDFYTTGNEPDGRLHLVYSFDIYAQKPLSRSVIFVDATTGKVLLSDAILKHAATTGASLYSRRVPINTSGSYILSDTTRGNGVRTYNMNNGTSYASATDFTSTTNNWPVSSADSAAVDAQWAAEKVYDYWDSVQNRLSWDNANGILQQYVHYDAGYDNAFWDGSKMTYGDGSGLAAGGFTPLVSLDVTAHEIGHGVCEATANLVYSRESGAMNEGFSDCWGATIEYWANPNETDAVTKNEWLIGEEIGGGSPLRSMSNPNSQGQPDTYGGTYWYGVAGCTPSGANDNCGVHTNSGVLNYWYYLVTIGGSGTNDIGHSYAVTGIGWTKAADILYQTELLLTSGADYAACRVASVNAATTIFGTCSPELEAVTAAWYAVGVGLPYNPCIPQIGYVDLATDVTEYASANSCTASHVAMIPIKALGPPISGGTPTITAIASGGTAIAGVHYSLPATTLSFAAGDTSTIQYVPVTIYDNGALRDNKDFYLSFSINAMGTSTIISPANGQCHVFIKNDDFAPVAGGIEYHQVNDSNALSNLTSAFWGSRNKARSQYLLSPTELNAAGVRANVPITQLAFKVAQKNTTQPYTGYTLSIGNTGITNLSSNFIATSLTTVYSANFSTYVGWDSLDFTTPFTWDGISYVAIQVCFSNASAASGNDRVAGATGSATTTAYNYATTGVGCTLSHNASRTNTAKPIMRLKQVVQPSNVETVMSASRLWNVDNWQETYFYNNADSAVIMGLKNPSLNLACVSATLTGAGVGFAPFSFTSGVNRSLKEFTMTPATNAASTAYDATIYFKNTELNGAEPTSLYLIKTDAATDAGINSSNSVFLAPNITYGTDYTAFSGHFIGFSRFFLVDGYVPALSVTAPALAGDNLKAENPFHNTINITYSLLADGGTTVKLMDMTGRMLHTEKLTLSRGTHKLTLDISAQNLVSGTYILQVVTAENVYTRKLIRE